MMSGISNLPDLFMIYCIITYSQLSWGIGSLFSAVCEGDMGFYDSLPPPDRMYLTACSTISLNPSDQICVNMTVLMCIPSHNVITEPLRFRGPQTRCTAYFHNTKERGQAPLRHYRKIRESMN